MQRSRRTATLLELLAGAARASLVASGLVAGDRHASRLSHAFFCRRFNSKGSGSQYFETSLVTSSAAHTRAALYATPLSA